MFICLCGGQLHRVTRSQRIQESIQTHKLGQLLASLTDNMIIALNLPTPQESCIVNVYATLRKGCSGVLSDITLTLQFNLFTFLEEMYSAQLP